MTDLILHLYDRLRRHPMGRRCAWTALTLLLLVLVGRLSYKEDITDFLPVGSEHSHALAVYQDIAGADKLFVVFQNREGEADPDQMVESVDLFADEVQRRDTACQGQAILAQVDWESMMQGAAFVYENIPYLLTDADYARIDTLLAQPHFVAHRLQDDKRMLLMPSGGIVADNIQRDPLQLFTPTLERLQRRDTQLSYEIYEGHIFTPDMQRAVVVMTSPYGSSETEHNAAWLERVRAAADAVCATAEGLEIHLIGAPAVAVGNAQQIKADSLLSVGLSALLILLLLFFTLRNGRNLLLILLSIAWGWLFAMGGLAMLHDRVSVIVIGISSIILGIAVNYPLHFIAHLSHTPDKRKALSEIVMPLLVGNVTTVGAFLALVPLPSVALRDLGLFSSLLLVGTILFVLVCLPHLAAAGKPTSPTFLDRLSRLSPEGKPAVVWAVVGLTLLLGYYSLQTTFDANMSHINYMTDEQRADMDYFQRMMTTEGEAQKVYLLSTDTTLDGALEKSQRLQPLLEEMLAEGTIVDRSSCVPLLCSKAEQARRLARWQTFVERHGGRLEEELLAAARSEGFADGSFADFLSLLHASFAPAEISHFEPLVRTFFASHISGDSIEGRYDMVDVLSVAPDKVQPVEEALSAEGCFSFDVASMNRAIARRFSADFNYIGWACGCIVFLFLWLSMGSIELALLSFVPMAVSWLWILGIMSLLGIQFNIVNIILATFIFGQGDDYTIFMTEGASYEYAYRRKMLASYKHSIILSALIMFMGIGTLIFARHPALHSLAEVTIAGMFSVVLMAYIFPPLIFRFLVQAKGEYRVRPISLRPLGVRILATVVWSVQTAAVYGVGVLLFRWRKPTASRQWGFRRWVGRQCLFALSHIPTLRYVVEVAEPTGDRPLLLLPNRRSLLSVVGCLALHPSLCVASYAPLSRHRLFNELLQWLGCVQLADNAAKGAQRLHEEVAAGHSIALFMEEDKETDNGFTPSALERALSWAETLGVDLVPLFWHGMELLSPAHTPCIFAGQLTMALQPSVERADNRRGEVACRLKEAYERLRDRLETPDRLVGVVLDRYRYKGTEPFVAVKRSLKHYPAFFDRMDSQEGEGPLTIANESYGELPLLYALVHRKQELWVVEPNDERRDLLRYCAEGIAPNLHVVEHETDKENKKQRNRPCIGE